MNLTLIPLILPSQSLSLYSVCSQWIKRVTVVTSFLTPNSMSLSMASQPHVSRVCPEAGETGSKSLVIDMDQTTRFSDHGPAHRGVREVDLD